MAKITQEEIWNNIKLLDDDITLQDLRLMMKISPEADVNFRMCMTALGKAKKIKRIGRGIYRVIKQVKPVRWWDADESRFFEITFPKSYEDETFFGFQDAINISPGDLIVVGGVSNYGKTGLVLSILGENLDKHQCLLMGNEYASLDGIPSPKFKRRMKRMSWAKWFNGKGEARFDLLPIREDHEDYVRSGYLNIVDWINLTDNFFKIGAILENIKANIGDGVAIVVLQKDEDKDLSRGKGFTRDLVDLYLTIDPYGENESRLTVGKVKDPKSFFDRLWAFEIVDYGANFRNIRPLKKCPKCYTKGWVSGRPCEECNKKGYIDKH